MLLTGCTPRSNLPSPRSHLSRIGSSIVPGSAGGDSADKALQRLQLHWKEMKSRRQPFGGLLVLSLTNRQPYDVVVLAAIVLQ